MNTKELFQKISECAELSNKLNNELIQQVKSGEISSNSYMTFEEYKKAMDKDLKNR